MTKRLIQSIVRAAGYELIEKKTSFDLLKRFFATVKKVGFEPTYIIDVGANHGKWTRIALAFYPNAGVTMIEPQAQLKADVEDLLKRPSMKWITAGAGAQSGTLKFTVNPSDHSSSFALTAQQAIDEGMQQIDVPIVTLNQVVADNGGRIPELVKIDADGFDLKVIDDASDLIGKTEVFLLESAICAKGIENNLARTIRKMDDLAYEPFDITDLNYSPTQGLLWLVEMVFVRKAGILASKASTY